MPEDNLVHNVPNQVTEETVVVKQINVPSPNQETRIKFWAFGAPTPKEATEAFNIFFAITGIIVFGLNTFTFIPPHLKDTINEVTIFLIYVAKYTAKSFGIVVKEPC